MENAVFEVIMARRSIRSYQEKPVERETLVRLLKAGMAAPSACNLQPWEFIVVTEKEQMDALRRLCHQGDYNAPAAVVFCGSPSHIPWEGDGWMIDCSMAAENMLLAAQAMGLGSVCIGGFDGTGLRELLRIPSKVIPMMVVYFGYPAEEKLPRTYYNEMAVYWESYDPERRRSMRTLDMLYDNLP